MMASAIKARVLAWSVLVAGSVSACVHAPGETLTPAQYPAAVSSARDVLAAGYATIAERYIDPVTIEAVAMNGIGGLHALDPAVTVRRQEDDLVLTVGADTVFRQAVPDADDAEGWADLTARAWASAGKTTPGLAAADAERVYEAVFDASLAPLDRFSKYASAEEARANRQRRYGHGDIGADVTLHGGMARVTKVRDRGPAARAGMRAGDWITHIDDTAVSDLSQSDISERLGGPSGTWVTLTVRRPPARLPELLGVPREHRVEETVATAQGDGILYLGVKGFNRGTVGRVWSLLHEAAHDPGGPLKGVILDLRGNPGGLLDQSIRVADLFLDGGPVITTLGRHPDSVRSYQATGPDVVAALPLVILIDGGSASAAEIVAAALQDRGRAVVVGTASYGKGTVQTVVPLPNEGELILTWSRLVTPSGWVLQERGVSPALCTSGMTAGGEPTMARLLARRMGRSHDGVFGSSGVPCPPQARETTLEIAIARRILNDWSMYSALIRPRTGTAQAMY